MPFINVKQSSINRNRNVLGREKRPDTAILQVETNTITEMVYELITDDVAGENLTAFTPGYMSSTGVFAASPLFSDGKPCNCIILETVSSGEAVKVQIGGLCQTNLTLTANKDLFFRYGAAPITHQPITAVTVNEDTHQRLGRAINGSQILLTIETPKKLT